MNQTNSVNNQVRQSIDVDFNVMNDWSQWGGFTGSISFTNKGKSFEGWTIEFDAPFDIYEIWRGEIVSRKGNRYVIKDVSWNKDVDPDETVDFVFNARVPDKKVTTPNNYLFNQRPLNDSLAMPKPSLPSPPPSPTSISSNAISVGFEQHSPYTKYTRSAQSKDWKVLWSEDGKMNNYSMITNEIALSGEKSLKMTYPSNTQGGGGAAWQVPAQKEYYLSYWLNFDKNFDFDGPKHSGGKMPGLGGAGGLCSGGDTCNGNNGFTSRYMWRENGRAVLYLYHMGKQKWGDDFRLQGSDGSDKYFERGKWHNLVQRVQINDGNQSNGEIDIWMDKEKVLSLDNLKFVTNNKGIDTVFFNTFHGGSSSDWWPEREVYAYFDDFVVSTNASDVGL
ncbi:cellulose binding domain-containing protein [Pleurocapsales cyanobacterium LEGE 06147]|nr:cellulose binding domain-containing protein [Pleurocapsales cyanobacterium LEGE 06147]